MQHSGMHSFPNGSSGNCVSLTPPVRVGWSGPLQERKGIYRWILQKDESVVINTGIRL